MSLPLVVHGPPPSPKIPRRQVPDAINIKSTLVSSYVSSAVFNLISYRTNFLLLIHQNDHDRIHLLVRLIIAGLLVTIPLALSWKSRTSRFVLFMSRSKAVDVRIQAALGLPAGVGTDKGLVDWGR